MIIQFKLAGLALAGGAFLSKSGKLPFSSRKLLPPVRQRPFRKPVHMKIKPVSVPESLQRFVNGLSTSLSALVSRPSKEDYNAIINSFTPEKATLLTPEYPANAGKMQWVDVDGDSQKELVTSYRSADQVTTMILKKVNGQWGKVAEIKNNTGDKINFMGSADITGEGKRQLLLGYTTGEHIGKLHGYALKDKNMEDLFTHDYNRIEVLERSGNKGTSERAQLAFWNAGGSPEFNVDVMRWNGTELESVKNPAPYYQARVLPYYGQKVRQAPQNPSHWYNLAFALDKVGMYKDAMSAIEFGMYQKPASPLDEDFLKLKNEVTEKIKS